MESIIPEQLKPEQQAVEAAIRKAFAGVTREGGVSWSQSYVIDDYGSAEAQLAAQAEDKENGWEDLVADPNWYETWSGGFCFLDAIGFRYYAAAAMVKAVRTGDVGSLAFHLKLTEHDEYRLAALSRFTPEQLQVTARFVRFMRALARAENDCCNVDDWEAAYELYWQRFDLPPVP